MKALQITAPGKSTIVDLPRPEPGPGEVLFRITGVTTCPQWDLHLRHNEPMFIWNQPFTFPYPPDKPGHEATGTVEAVGPDVSGIEPGQTVAVWAHGSAGEYGLYAQYGVARAANLVVIPSGLPPEATAPTELASCVAACFIMLREMDAVSGRDFAVSGLGPAGLVAVQLARAEGARSVTGFDLLASRRSLADSLGADATCDPREASAEKFPVRRGNLAFQSGIDCVGAKTSVEFLMDRIQDTLALFGVPREPYAYEPRHWVGLRLCGYPGFKREAADWVAELIASGELRLGPLTTHHLPFERYEEAVDLLEKQEAIKVCFDPWA